MKDETLMFAGTSGLKLFLDNDIYRLKENIQVQAKPLEPVLDTLFVEKPADIQSKPTVKLLVLVENASKTTQSAKDTEFLTKLVNAVGIHMKDVAIKSLEDATTIESKKAVLFVSLKDKIETLPTFEGYNQELKKYTLMPVYNQQVIWADSLDSIQDSVEMKKLLWAGLKIMFGLS